MKRTELNFIQKIWLEFLWLGARVFAMMPYWLKYYIVENLLFFIIYYCLRYRMKVVKANLRNSFPEKSEQERAAVCRSFYRTLAVKGFEEHYAKVHGRDWIAMTAHFGCWEYCSYWGLYERSQMLVAVYHPLRSKVMERLYQRLRNYENSMTVAMKDSLRFYLRNRERGIEGKNLVMGLIADQNPPRRPDSHWFRFLNRDTIFFDGGEKLALRCGLPVYCCWLRRVKPGYYEMDFDRIYDGEEEVAPHEITERYVRRLEQKIREYPDLWMWSHKRWKHKSPADLARMECERKQK